MYQLKKLVQEMDDQDVRQGLLAFLYTVKEYKEEGKHSDSFMTEIVQLYKELTITPEETAKRRLVPNQNTDTVHIVFGESTAGSVRQVIKQLGLQESDGIICFPDLFSVGPIWKLHEPEGRLYRKEWIRNHLDPEYTDDNYAFTGELNPIEMVQQIPEQAQIVIWGGNSAHERIGSRYVQYLLREYRNQMIEINAVDICERKYNIADDQKYFHTGEIAIDKLIEVFLEIKRIPPLTNVERDNYEQEWMIYAGTKQVLRLWMDGEINTVEQNHLDEYLLHTVYKLQSRSNPEAFLKAARIIGEAIGYFDEYIGDSFFEYRLRSLIYEGKLEICGIPKAMRYYSVRIKL
ncbi:DUF1835 domain-containing protein [Paenibacillus sp. Marseille-Q4541]|uniref:DUF1835 domain-containing protein n=1 Tax=Paenibacillus sp. Marseille-Q4541 TaxID=2831522 RepID=UPI001BA7D143|nr:DUF1835 domain-containing protein [Paenibacillus sp. Marseille-Q4541]